MSNFLECNVFTCVHCAFYTPNILFHFSTLSATLVGEYNNVFPYLRQMLIQILFPDGKDSLLEPCVSQGLVGPTPSHQKCEGWLVCQRQSCQTEDVVKKVWNIAIKEKIYLCIFFLSFFIYFYKLTLTICITFTVSVQYFQSTQALEELTVHEN